MDQRGFGASDRPRPDVFFFSFFFSIIYYHYLFIDFIYLYIYICIYYVCIAWLLSPPHPTDVLGQKICCFTWGFARDHPPGKDPEHHDSC